MTPGSSCRVSWDGCCWVMFWCGRWFWARHATTIILTYIYLEPTWPLFWYVLIGKGLVLLGWPSKIEVSWVLGAHIYSYTFFSVHIKDLFQVILGGHLLFSIHLQTPSHYGQPRWNRWHFRLNETRICSSFLFFSVCPHQARKKMPFFLSFFSSSPPKLVMTLLWDVWYSWSCFGIITRHPSKTWCFV